MSKMIMHLFKHYFFYVQNVHLYMYLLIKKIIIQANLNKSNFFTMDEPVPLHFDVTTHTTRAETMPFSQTLRAKSSSTPTTQRD